MEAKLGDILHVIFRDHCIAKGRHVARRELTLECFGRLVKANRRYIYLATWKEAGGELDHNAEVTMLVLSTVLAIRRLGR